MRLRLKHCCFQSILLRPLTNSLFESVSGHSVSVDQNVSGNLSANIAHSTQHSKQTQHFRFFCVHHSHHVRIGQFERHIVEFLFQNGKPQKSFIGGGSEIFGEGEFVEEEVRIGSRAIRVDVFVWGVPDDSFLLFLAVVFVHVSEEVVSMTTSDGGEVDGIP